MFRPFFLDVAVTMEEYDQVQIDQRQCSTLGAFIASFHRSKSSFSQQVWDVIAVGSGK